MGQIVGYFLLLSFVTVSVISGVTYLQSRNAIKRALLERLSLTAALKEDELNRWVEDQREEVIAIANLPNVQESILTLIDSEADADEAEIQETKAYLKELMVAIADQHSSLSEIFILTSGGRVILSTQPDTEGKFESLVQYSYIFPDQDDSFHPNFYLSPNTNTSQMSFAIPITASGNHDGANPPTGILAMHLNLSRIDAIIRTRTG